MNFNEELDRLHRVWFGESPESGVPPSARRLWFDKDPDLDRMLSAKFGSFHAQVTDRERVRDLISSIETDRRMVAFIVLLDQVSRNLYRNRPRAYKHDDWALELSKQMVETGHDRKRLPVERAFIYMPYRHAEEREVQEQAVRLYRQLSEESPSHWQESAKEFLEYARRSFEVIREFGRFPHRNKILGRQNTPAEERYLSNSRSRF